MTTSENPLLAGGFRLPFHEIEARHVEPGIRQAIARAQAEIDAVSADPAPPGWANTMEALERTVETLAERVAPVTHLATVAETAALREAYNTVLPDITAFWSRLPLNEALWQRIKAYAATPDARDLNGIRRRHLDKTMREFQHAGADLPPAAKARLEAVRIELARLQQTFSENVLDATAAYELLIAREQRLDGVPAAARRRAREKAEAKGKEGWLLTLDYPSVEPILKHCHDRSLRQEIHLAYATRCREGEFDNRGLLARILRLRDEIAEILGYESFPDYTLEDRMAGSGARAAAFEADLVDRTRPYWERDVAQLRTHASALGIDDLEPWDASYVMEQLRRKRYDIDDETLRPYFPLPRVLDGLFEIVRRTFGFRIEEREIEQVWHDDVRYFELFDEADGTMVGAFYSDWFPRPEKRQGAWMNHFITGGPRLEGFAPHLGVICGNFTPPDGNGPALLTHREVETTFHEFGHLLHHCTSRVPVPSRAGINVAWDFVELPSQLMENWTWEREALDLIAGHHETGEPLPQEIFERMMAARRYMGGWAQMRQLSLGTVDLSLHGELAPRLRAETTSASSPDSSPDGLDDRQGDAVMEFGEERFSPFAAQPRFAELHMLTSFTHLFAGGYAAAYYSYLWSEVLDADVFTRFREEGIFDRETGRRYVDAILSRGDSADPDQLFLDFMGRPPDPSALLERNLGPLTED